MPVICLIACASRKRDEICAAAELYDSSLFKKSLAYAKSLSPNDIFILSAKYGLVDLAETIAPYEMTLNTMPVGARRAWGERVLGQLRLVSDLKNDKFIFLAGQKYRDPLTKHMPYWSAPLAGKRIGQQLRWLTGQIR